MSVVVPSPSWPLSFLPQHLIAPPVSRGQVWSSPAEISVTSASATVASAEKEKSQIFIFRVKVVIVPPVARASRDPVGNTKIFAAPEFPERTNVGTLAPQYQTRAKRHFPVTVSGRIAGEGTLAFASVEVGLLLRR